MGDFANGRNVLLRPPSPGRPINPAPSVVKETKIEQKDINAIADAVIKAISNKIPTMVVHPSQQPEEAFDNSASLDKLAQAMIIERDTKESNVEGMGTTRETKKDKGETDKTIDMLSKIGD